MVRYFKLVLFFFVLISAQSYANQLDITQLKAFNELILKETKDSPQNIFKYLSSELLVESHFGSSVQGVIFSFNKTEYINLINKSLDKINESNKDQDIDVFDFKIISASKGQFTVKTYSKTIRRSIWSTYTVKLIKDEIKIIKIVDLA